MIKRRRPEQSDEPSEGEATESKAEGQEARESTGGTQPAGADASAADTGDTTASSAAADESTPAADGDQPGAAASGRKRNRRRRGKAATSSDGAAAPEGESTPADEASASPGAPDSATSAATTDTGSRDESAADPDPGEVAAEDGDGAEGDTRELPPAAPPPRRGGRGLAVFALLVALIAAGGAGWLGWRVLQLERQVAAVPEQREQALAPLASQEALDSVEQRLDRGLGSLDDAQQRLSQLADEQQRLQGERQAVLDDLRTRIETVEAAQENLRDQRERDGADWRMAEVRYLVSIAVQRLAISGDLAGSIAALQAADQSLARMGDPRVIELRKQIVDDIEALQAVEPADVEGIALRIQNLAPRIPHLERPASPQPDPESEAGPEPADDASDGETAQGWWGTIREQVGSLVTVRREAVADAPSASEPPAGPAPSAELPAGERLLLVLKDASRAALNHAPQAYEESIGRALDLLDAEFAESGPVVDRFREALEDLHGRRVTTDLPDLAPTFERTEEVAARLERDGSGTASQGDN